MKAERPLNADYGGLDTLDLHPAPDGFYRSCINPEQAVRITDVRQIGRAGWMCTIADLERTVVGWRVCSVTDNAHLFRQLFVQAYEPMELPL